MRLPDPPVLAGAAPGLIFSSGAPLPFAAATAARARFGTLPIEVLGSTETGGIAWRQQDETDALWTTLPGVVADIDNEGALRVSSPFAGEAVTTGDVAERMGERLRLVGRADRVAKIDGKRVSLARVEQALLALPFVEAAAAIDLPARKGRLGAIVALNAEGLSALEAQGAFRFSRALRGALAARLEPSERPKHWRFAPIPLDRQGKRVQSLLRAAFADAPPDWMGRGSVLSVAADRAEIEIYMPGELVWFEGHFPEEPVLPGIAQVHLAAQWAQHLWKWEPEGASLFRLKFRHVIRPGETVRLALARDSLRGRLRFAYQRAGSVASEGTIGGGE
jgi:hypothetical protein